MSKYTKKETRWYPNVVRIRRNKGNVVQGCELYISKECMSGGWNTSRSKWYNQDLKNEPEDYMKWIHENKKLNSSIYELVGQMLGCWCQGPRLKSCHGNVLVQETKKFIDEYFKQFRKKDRDLSNILNGSNQTHQNILKLEIIPFRRIKYRKKDSTPIQLEIDQIVKKLPLKLSKQPKIKIDKKKNNLIWDDIQKKWDMSYANNIQLTDDMKLTGEACVYFKQGKYSWVGWDLPRNSQLFDDGKISVTEMIKQSHIKYNKSVNIGKIIHPYNFDDHIYIQANNPIITNSAITDLYLGKRKERESFVCEVKARLFNKKTQRYMLKVYDGVGLFKVQIASQLFDMIKEKFIDKGDIIKVLHYACSKISLRKKIVVLYDIKKIIMSHK